MTTLLATEVFKNPATLDIYVHAIITKMSGLWWENCVKTHTRNSLEA